MANDMDMTRYNPHNLFKAIVYLDKFIENEGLANKVKQQISEYYQQYRKTNPPKSKYQTQNHLFLKLKEYCSQKGLKIEQEVTIDPYDLIFVDMALKDQKKVIEINGPFHYLQGNT